MFHPVPLSLTGRFKMVSILSTCPKRSQMHRQIQLLSSILSLLQPQRFRHQYLKPRVRTPFHEIEDGADFERAAALSSATLSPMPQDYTNNLNLLTGSVILAMICGIFAGVVLAVFLYYRRTIRHYGIERMDRSVEKERRMSLILTLQPSESQPNRPRDCDANKYQLCLLLYLQLALSW
jgi:hypothetical protein